MMYMLKPVALAWPKNKVTRRDCSWGITMIDKKKEAERQRQWKVKNPNYQNEWRARNRDKWNASVKRRRDAIRLGVLQHYSGGTPHCACCGEKHMEFLCIDHIDGGGGKHRKELRGGSVLFYEWLRKQGYPSGYRVLCHNCNMSLGFYGYCPHQIKED